MVILIEIDPTAIMEIKPHVKMADIRRVEPLIIRRVDPWLNSPPVGGSTLLVQMK